MLKLESSGFHLLYFSEGKVAKPRDVWSSVNHRLEGPVGLATAWLRRKPGSLWVCMHTDASTLSPEDTVSFSFEYTLPFTSFPVSDIVCNPLPYQSITVGNVRMHEFLLPPIALWQVKD